MSCRACSIPVDCVGLDGNPSSDIAPSFGFFATQDYRFVLDCPAGYICFPGRNPVQIIPGTIIPPITTDGSEMCIQGCLSMVCVTPLPNASQADLQGLANFLFFEYAQQQAACNNRRKPQAPGIPPPTLVGGRGSQIDIYNVQECYTAHCVPDTAGTPQTVCIPAGTHGTTLLDPTPSTVATIQDQMNSLALTEATNQAIKQLGCGVCNAQAHAFTVCPTNPLLIASVTIPPNTYCLPLPATQFQVDSQANIALNNQLTAILAGLGCTCPGATVGGGPGGFNITIPAPCGLVQATWNLNSPTGPFAISPSFNPAVQWCNFNAAGYPCNHAFPLNSDLFSSIFPNSHLLQYIPPFP